MVKGVPSPKGLVDKAIKRTDAIGGLFGFFGGFSFSLDSLSVTIQAIAQGPRTPNFPVIAKTTWDNGVVPMLLPIVAGELMKYMGVYSKWGGALSKFGFGYIGGQLASTVLINSHNPGGLQGAQTGVSTAGRVSESVTGRASYPTAAVSTFGRPTM